jgi:hypothetical protein
MVDEAGLYPGLAPRRIRLGRCQRAALRAEDIERLVQGATDDLSEIQRRLAERAVVPFGEAEVAVLFRPAMVLGPSDREKPERSSNRRADRIGVTRTVGAVDGVGRFLRVTLMGTVADELAVISQAPGTFALFGIASLGDSGLGLRCLSVLVSASSPVWQAGRGRIVPEAW